MLDTYLGVDHLGVGHMDRGTPLEADLAKGLRNDEFTLHYQPICSSRSGHVVGVEALLRWSSERIGPVGPSAFIPLAERTGQRTMFYREQRNIADVNANFMDLVREGMTREELARNIERRPSLWKRFEGFLNVLPSSGQLHAA
jgi:EAL domain-containing protein (putative c-di-GMP-specific phosphodiesterase class I)